MMTRPKDDLRFVVPVDFSRCSTAAVEHAVGLARETGASIELVHAWCPPYDLSPFLGSMHVNNEDGTSRTVFEVLRGESAEQLEALADATRKKYDRVKATMAEGDPREAIAGLAEPSRCDMMIMGTRGRTGIARLLLGSVAEWVVRHSRVPVITVQAAES